MAVSAVVEINMIIGISGYARSGKDTFGLSLQRVLETFKIKSKVNAFANVLKQDLDSFLIKKFNISAFTKNDEEKSQTILIILNNSTYLNEFKNRTAIILDGDEVIINQVGWGGVRLGRLDIEWDGKLNAKITDIEVR